MPAPSNEQLFSELNVLRVRHESLKERHEHLKDVTIGEDGGNGLRQDFKDFKNEMNAELQQIRTQLEHMDEARAAAKKFQIDLKTGVVLGVVMIGANVMIDIVVSRILGG